MNECTGVQAEADADSEAEDMVHAQDADSDVREDLATDRKAARDSDHRVDADSDHVEVKVSGQEVRTDRLIKVMPLVTTINKNRRRLSVNLRNTFD